MCMCVFVLHVSVYYVYVFLCMTSLKCVHVWCLLHGVCVCGGGGVCVCVVCLCCEWDERLRADAQGPLDTESLFVKEERGREGRREDHRGRKEEMKGWGRGVMGWEATRRREAGRGRGLSLVLRKPGCKTTHRRLP